MTELKTKIRYLIREYNHAVKYQNGIDAIDIDCTITQSCELDSVLDVYTVRYEDGTSQTFNTFDVMFFYIKGIIDGIEKTKKINESED